MANPPTSRREFLLLSAGLIGGFPQESPIERRLAGTIPRLMEEHRVPGLQIAIVQDGMVVWSQGFGQREIGTGKSVTPATIFEMASLSKPAFAYAALKLVDAGRLDLDAPLARYLPAPFLPEEPRAEAITARMALAHTSGLPHGRQGGRPIGLLFPPGRRFQYSATGFDYLQRVVLHLTKQPLEIFMKEALLDPLGMTASNFGWREPYAESRALGYNAKGEAGQTFNEKYRMASPQWREAFAKSNPELSYPSAAAGMYGTAEDFARYLLEIVRPSGKDSSRLSDRLLNEMLSPQVEITKEASWGLGWGILQTKMDDAFWHWGNWNGLYQHFAAILKKEKRGVVILTNSGNGLELCKKLLPLMIGLDIKPLHRFFD